MVAFKDSRDAFKFSLDVQEVLFHADWPDDVDHIYRDLQAEAYDESKASAEGTCLPETDPSDWQDDATYNTRWHGIRVRIGMHWGIGSVKYDSVSQGYDYYGTVVNTAARVEGVGHGGQVLATKDMFDELCRVECDFTIAHVLPLGPQPLRGLDHPIPLYQILPVGPLSARRFPPLRLDVEIALDDEDDASSANKLASASQTSNFSAEAFASRLLRGKNPLLLERVLRDHAFLVTAFSMAPPKWQQTITKELLRFWKVSNTSGHSHNTMKDLTVLCHRVELATEERLRGDNLPDTDNGSGVVLLNRRRPSRRFSDMKQPNGSISIDTTSDNNNKA